MLRWGGVAGKRKLFNATIVSDGTVPQGSTWVRLSLLPGFNRFSRISQPLGLSTERGVKLLSRRRENSVDL